MTLCVNQSGTWRNITTQCVKQSGTWRKAVTGCINQSGTWRCYGFFNIAAAPLGSLCGGGYVLCKSSGVAWIVSPSSAQVSRNWYQRGHANSRAQQVSGCGGWFVPTIGQLQNPGSACKIYWDSYSSGYSWYWSSCQYRADLAWSQAIGPGNSAPNFSKHVVLNVRSFRCVTY